MLTSLARVHTAVAVYNNSALAGDWGRGAHRSTSESHRVDS